MTEMEEWKLRDSLRTKRVAALAKQPIDRVALKEAQAAGFNFKDAMIYARLVAKDAR